MKFKILCGAAVALSLASVGTAQTSDGTINFTGAISAQTCTVTSGTSGQTITLPTVAKSTFGAAGTRAGLTPFKVSLENCATVATNAKIFFEAGATIDTSTGNLINSGTATGVQVAIFQTAASATPINLATNTGATNVAFSTATVDLPYVAGYQSTVAAASIGAGTVTTSVVFSIQYP